MPYLPESMCQHRKQSHSLFRHIERNNPRNCGWGRSSISHFSEETPNWSVYGDVHTLDLLN